MKQLTDILMIQIIESDTALTLAPDDYVSTSADLTI